MTPQDKSKELIDKFYKSQVEVLNINGTTELESVEHKIAIKSSLIAVDEIIASIPTLPNNNNKLEKTTAITYWVEVKNELLKQQNS